MSITKRQLFHIFSPLLILLLPLIAMQISQEVNWTFMDFVVAAALILIASSGVYFLSKLAKGKMGKAIISILVIIAILLIWAELAVGIV